MKYFVIAVLLLLGVPWMARAESHITLAFPVEGDVTFSDTFDAPRSGGRIHEATDIMAAKMSPVLAAVDGVILFAPTEEPSYGYMIMLGGDDGYQYNYVHLNNDTPGTDDGLGGPEYAYVDGMTKGVRVSRGEQIAWVGDSGNAESTRPHLHFEIEASDGTMVNPYASLVAAHEVSLHATFSFHPEEEVADAESISENLGLSQSGDASCISESLIRTTSSPAVYYCGTNGGRYVFQNEGTYFSWYDDFTDVTVIPDDEMGNIPILGAVTYKPGTYLLKMPSVSKVYAVGRGGTLHWVPSASIAEALYGTDWEKMVRDLPESFYPAYEIGEDVTQE